MVRSPRLPPPAVPAPGLKAQAEDWAVVALLALTSHDLDPYALFKGASHLLAALGLPCPKTDAELRARLVQLQAQNLVRLATWGSASCAPAVREGVLLLVWRQGWGQALGEAFQTVQKRNYDYDPYPTVDDLRRSLFTEAFAEFLDRADHAKLPKTSPLAVLEEIAAALPQSLDQPWLCHLPPAVGHRVAWALLNRALLFWEPLAPLVEWLQGQAGADDTFRLILIEALLYQGRFEEAESEVQRLQPRGQAPWPG